MKRSLISGWCTALIVLVCAGPLLADGPQTGTIDGRVLDAQGAPLPGVTVTLTGPQNTRTVITDPDGVYRFALLLAGRYTVNAELEGLGAAELATDLDPGQRRGVDLTLVSATEEEITVTGEAPLISRYETALAATIPEEVTDNVAFGTRTYNAAIRQLPSVVNRNDADTVPSVNGGISTEVGVYVEGVDTSMHRRGGEMRLLIPSTALTETKLESTGFGAEYGRATSGIINSTVKTGTNEFHGEALYIGQNPKWRAPDILELERPDDQINSYETSVGGPLARNRAWFFVSYGRISDNRIDRLRDGTVVNLSRQADPLVAKVNFQPRDTQQIAVTAIDAPSDAIGLSGNPGDQYAIMNFPLNGRVQTLNWSLGLGASNFLEFKVANREEFVGRHAAEQHAIDPNASPDDPPGNNFRYRDLATGLRYNGPAVRLAEGFNDFPRDVVELQSYFQPSPPGRRACATDPPPWRREPTGLGTPWRASSAILRECREPWRCPCPTWPTAPMHCACRPTWRSTGIGCASASRSRSTPRRPSCNRSPRGSPAVVSHGAPPGPNGCPTTTTPTGLPTGTPRRHAGRTPRSARRTSSSIDSTARSPSSAAAGRSRR